MNKKEKTIFLVTPQGHKQEFSISHAERLLGMGKALNGGWDIDKDSNYYYDVENGIRLKTDKANSAKAK